MGLVAVDLLQLYVPRLIKYAVDDLVQATSTAMVWQAAGVLGLAFGGMAFLRLV
ncbi:hypothetical protein DFAR_2010007 [Desulfarculales bacterium]